MQSRNRREHERWIRATDMDSGSQRLVVLSRYGTVYQTTGCHAGPAQRGVPRPTPRRKVRKRGVNARPRRAGVCQVFPSADSRALGGVVSPALGRDVTRPARRQTGRRFRSILLPPRRKRPRSGPCTLDRQTGVGQRSSLLIGGSSSGTVDHLARQRTGRVWLAMPKTHCRSVRDTALGLFRCGFGTVELTGRRR